MQLWEGILLYFILLFCHTKWITSRIKTIINRLINIKFKICTLLVFLALFTMNVRFLCVSYKCTLLWVYHNSLQETATLRVVKCTNNIRFQTKTCHATFFLLKKTIISLLYTDAPLPSEKKSGRGTSVDRLNNYPLHCTTCGRIIYT